MTTWNPLIETDRLLVSEASALRLALSIVEESGVLQADVAWTGTAGKVVAVVGRCSHGVGKWIDLRDPRDQGEELHLSIDVGVIIRPDGEVIVCMAGTA